MALSVAEYAAKPFVQRAMQSPNHPHAVLSFFYGIDFSEKADDCAADDTNDENGKTGLELGTCLRKMAPLWFYGGPDYDALCEPFRELVRQAGKQQLQERYWHDTVDGCMSQVLLCDQFSRNIFRKQEEAFAYDEYARELTRKLVSLVLLESSKEEQDPAIKGEFYPPYFFSLVLPLMHSESLDDHEMVNRLLDRAKTQSLSKPELNHLVGWWDNFMTHELEHKEVLEKFGHYPHRNKAMGRQSTPEEIAWLEDVEHLPGWAKSQ